MDGNQTNPVFSCGIPEFVGTATGDTIGLVIANIDPELREKMLIEDRFHSIGVLGSRTGAGAQILAVDDAMKATNTEIISVELPRDTKGGGGHGCLIIIGAHNIADARKAIEIALELTDRNCGDIYVSSAGHMEFQYSARAGEAIKKAFDAPIGQAFGIICACPAPIGLFISDAAVKSADVTIVKCASPTRNTSLTNEVNIFISGEAAAVRQAVLTARHLGTQLLMTMGEKPESIAVPYIK